MLGSYSIMLSDSENLHYSTIMSCYNTLVHFIYFIVQLIFLSIFYYSFHLAKRLPSAHTDIMSVQTLSVVWCLIWLQTVAM